MLKQRIITAAVIVLVLSAALAYLSAPLLAVFFGVAVLMAAWEWAGMCSIIKPIGRAAYVLLCLLLMIAVYWRTGLFGEHNAEAIREIFLVAGLWWAIALLWVKSYPQSAGLWGSKPMRGLIGVLVLVPAWLALSYLRSLDNGVWMILMVVSIVVAADVGAYFSGRRFGKAKLAVAVSPGKSWAGFWGGLFCSVSLMALLWTFWPGGMPVALLPMLCIGLITALASVLGDLLESMVKRHRGIKDSGHLLPGHGGIMDRIDSITAAAPVFSLGLMAAGWA
jgi:phosphatidate cytidylyltransferase